MFQFRKNSVNITKMVQRKAIKIEDKLRILERAENGESVLLLSRELGVSESTIRKWRSQKPEMEKWIKKCDKRSKDTQYINENKRMKKSLHEDVDEAVYIWYWQNLAQGTRVTGPMLQNKALSFNELIGGKRTFLASSGWLTRWKIRYGIRLPLINKYRPEYNISIKGKQQKEILDKNIIFGGS